MPLDSVSLRPRRGRPRKFTVPSRPITLTLPEHVIEALAAVDPDISRAVVRLVQPELTKRPHLPVELTTFGRRAVIVVNPSRTLEEQAGIDLIPLPDGRALISFERAKSIADVELQIADALDGRLPAEDQKTFETIAEMLKTARRSDDVALLQRSIIVLERRRPAPSSGRRLLKRVKRPA